MPQYTVKDNETGKTITFDWQGQSPPTDADMEQVFSEAKGMQKPSASPLFQNIVSMIKDLPRNTVNLLPEIAATAGGITGAMLPPGNIPGGIAGAILGGSIGSHGKQALAPHVGLTGVPPIGSEEGRWQATSEGLKQGAAEYGFGTVAPWLMGKTLGPAAEKMTSAGRNLL